MKIKVLASWNQVMTYKDIWNGILEDIGSDIVFMTFEWLYMWWEYHNSGNKLFILMITQDDEVLGFCPLMKVPIKGYEEIRFIGGDEASYMGFIVRKECREKAILGILDYLMELSDRFLINIHGIPKETDDYKIIKRHLNGKQWGFLETSLESYYIDIGGKEFDSYLRTRFGRGSISTMKRKERRLKRLGKVSFKPINKSQQDIDTAFDIHDKRWQRKIGSSKFSIGQTREFFKSLALEKHLPFKTSLEIVNIEDRIISFIYGFEYKGRYIFYRIAHDDNFGIFSPGELVLRQKIEDCFKKRLRVFDFGLGFEPYKAVWAADKMDVTSFLFPSNNGFSRLIFKIHHWKWKTRQSLKGNPKIYHFVKYKLGRIKFLFYPENTKRAIKRGFDRLKDKIRNISKFLYWTDDYHIMNKQLRKYQGSIDRIYRVEEATVEKLDLLMDITLMDSSSILRRILKGDKCIIVYTDQDIFFLWLDSVALNIEKAGYTLAMDKKSICICDYYSSQKKGKINRKILQHVLEFLREQGYEQCYVAVRKKDPLYLNMLKGEGFEKFLRVKFKRQLGKESYKEYKGSLK